MWGDTLVSGPMCVPSAQPPSPLTLVWDAIKFVIPTVLRKVTRAGSAIKDLHLSLLCGIMCDLFTRRKGPLSVMSVPESLAQKFAYRAIKELTQGKNRISVTFVLWPLPIILHSPNTDVCTLVRNPINVTFVPQRSIAWVVCGGTWSGAILRIIGAVNAHWDLRQRQACHITYTRNTSSRGKERETRPMLLQMVGDRKAQGSINLPRRRRSLSRRTPTLAVCAQLHTHAEKPWQLIESRITERRLKSFSVNIVPNLSPAGAAWCCTCVVTLSRLPIPAPPAPLRSTTPASWPPIRPDTAARNATCVSSALPASTTSRIWRCTWWFTRMRDPSSAKLVLQLSNDSKTWGDTGGYIPVGLTSASSALLNSKCTISCRYIGNLIVIQIRGWMCVMINLFTAVPCEVLRWTFASWDNFGPRWQKYELMWWWLVGPITVSSVLQNSKCTIICKYYRRSHTNLRIDVCLTSSLLYHDKFLGGLSHTSR